MRNGIIPIFNRGDQVDNVSLVLEGPIHLEFPGARPILIKGSNLVVGTLEPLLCSHDPLQTSRLISVYRESNTELRVIPLDSFEELLLDYEFGFATNRTLSQLLELSNQYYLALSKAVGKEIKKYRVRAIHFSHLLDDLHALSRIPSLRDLGPLVQAATGKDLYRDGCLFSREHKMRSLSLSPHPLTELIESYKQGSLICNQGELADSMYILLDGSIGVSVDKRYLASIDEPGEAFGELSLFLHGTRGATLTAERDSMVYILREENVPKFHRRHRDLFANIAGTLAKRVHDSIERALRFARMLDDGSAIESQSWDDLRQFHDQVLELQRQLRSDTLRKILDKHSVV